MTQIPEPGDWPCQQDGITNPPPRLLSVLYVLLRDWVQPGDLEQTCIQVQEDVDVDFTNAHLESYARSLIGFLLADWVQGKQYPYEEARSIVLGPGVFVSLDKSVLNWRGVNYIIQPEPGEEPVSPPAVMRDAGGRRFVLGVKDGVVAAVPAEEA